MKNTAVTLLLVLLTQPCFALSDPPARCPSIAMLKSGGVDTAYYDSVNGWFGTTSYSKYDTEDMWSFSVATGRDVNNAEDAIIRAKSTLTTLKSVIGPFKFDRTGQTIERWGCYYTGQGYAIALTPTLPDL